MPRIRLGKRQASEQTKETNLPARARSPCRRRELRSVHLGSINSNNWLPLLAFRKRLIADEVAPESSAPSVAPTSEASETTAARGIPNTACRPISAAKKQQILSLEPTGMSAREIAAQVYFSNSAPSPRFGEGFALFLQNSLFPQTQQCKRTNEVQKADHRRYCSLTRSRGL